ncbi:RuvC-like resolvase [Arthrobacter phage Thunderclap]|uniref:RuvC-like resolvase n=1 Tax=Arthrobacter phage Thunderclap TaxID=2777309 RepID=A0A7M1RPD4_9CAUD|nr:RuvC-like resolvase [Arthrobacter phage Thunderclap]
MIVVGIDPGGKTGVAVHNDKPTKIRPETEFHEVEGGFEGFMDWWECAWRWNRWDALDRVHIIVEQFDLRNQEFVADITPKEIIGMLRYWAMLHDTELWWATPSAHKSLVTDEALKRAGLHPPRGQVKGGHSRDAMRLVAYHRIHHLRDREFSERLFPKNNN